MDQQRLFRITFLGLVFWASFLFGYWLFSGIYLSCLLLHSYFNAILILLSSPALGFIISTLIHGFIRLFVGIKAEYSLPTNAYRGYYINSLQRAANIIINNRNAELNKNRNLKKLYIYHQIVIRENMKSELISFCVRRMNIYWTQINIMGTIIIGIFFGLCYLSYKSSTCLLDSTYHEFNCQKLYTLIPLVIYYIAAIFHLKRARREVSDIEINWVIKNF